MACYMSNFIIGYSENDVLYNNAVLSHCSPSTCADEDRTRCGDNGSAATHLKNALDNYSALKTKLEDKNREHNREVLFTVNLIIGLGLLSMYFYGVHRAGETA